MMKYITAAFIRLIFLQLWWFASTIAEVSDGTCSFIDDSSVLKLVVDSTQTATLFENEDDTVATESLMVGRASNGLRHSLIRFNIPRLPKDTYIECVQLELTIQPSISMDSGNQVYQLFAVDTQWASISQLPLDGTNGHRAARGDPTWKYRDYDYQEWNRPGGDYTPENVLATEHIISSNKHFFSNSTAFREAVQDWVLKRQPHYGFIIQAALNSDQELSYIVYDGAYVETRPKLYIFYTSPNSGFPHKTHPAPDDGTRQPDPTSSPSPSGINSVALQDAGFASNQNVGVIVGVVSFTVIGIFAIILTIVLTNKNVEGKVDESQVFEKYGDRRTNGIVID